MSVELTEEKIGRAIDERREEAEELLKEKDKLEAYLIKAEEKLKNMKGIGIGLKDIPLLISMVRSYLKKEFTGVPLVTIIGIIAAIIYVVNPADLIPDTIPGIGLVDDTAVVLFAMKMAGADLQIYRDWRTELYGE